MNKLTWLIFTLILMLIITLSPAVSETIDPALETPVYVLEEEPIEPEVMAASQN